jgi:ABC-type nitrate/sulfonate/bicarbonate transport system substrate-binding protein
MKRNRVGAGLALAAAVLVGIVACGNGSTPPSTSTKTFNAPSSVSLGYIGLFSAPTSLASAIATQQQYFGQVEQQFHTKFTFHQYSAATQLTAAFFGGTDQIMSGNVAGTVIAPAVNGQDVVGIYNQFEGPGTVIVGANKYKTSRGSNLKAYDGGAWCYLVAGTITEAWAIQTAQAQGLDWKHQKGVAIGSGAAYLPTLQNGTCDVNVGMDTVSAANAVVQNIGYVAQNMSDESYQQSSLGGIQLGTGYVTSSSFMKQYRDLVRAIVAQLLKATLFIQKNIDNANAIYSALPKEFTDNTSIGIFAQAWEYQKQSYKYAAGLFPPKNVDATLAFYKKAGIVKQDASLPKTAFTNLVVMDAYKDLNTPVPSGWDK